MKSPLPLLADFSDRLSPMVVKEMRQGLRTRFFTAALIAFHVVLGLLMLWFLFDVPPEAAHEMFWVIIITTLLGVLPARAWNALHAEAKEGTLDMLVLTGISSFRIVWGKWVSLYSQTLLVVSSLLPYMIARYQLGGVEIVRELVGLYLLILGSAVITAGMVAFSSQSLLMIRLLFSALVGVVAFGFGVYVFVLTVESSGERMWGNMMPKDLTGIVLLWSCITGLSTYLVYELLCIGSARLPMMKDSQSNVKRMVALIVLSLLTTLAWGMLWAGSPYRESDRLFVFLVSLSLTFIIGMDVLTEVARHAPHQRCGLKVQRLKSLFGPGWPLGVFFYMLISFLPLLAMVAVDDRTFWDPNIPEPLGIFGCILIANFVPVCLPKIQNQSGLGKWLIYQFLFVGLGILLAILGNALENDQRTMWCYLSVISPTTALFGLLGAPYSSREFFILTGTAVGLLWVLAAMFLAAREINRLRALAISSDSTTSPTDAELT